MAESTNILDPEELVKEALASNLDSSVFEIDDRDLPKAPNVIEWVLGATFLNSILFTKQAEQLVKLFMDYCPNCSDQEYIADVPVEDTSGMSEFRDRVQLLDYGVCPKCKQTRAAIVSDSNYVNIKEEFVGVWGQRSGKCVDGSTLLETEHGLIPISELFDGTEPDDTQIPKRVKLATGFGLNQTSYKLTKWHRKTVTIKTSCGFELTGSQAHPVLVLSERGLVYKQLQQVDVDDVLIINKSSHVWPLKLVNLSFEFNPKSQHSCGCCKSFTYCNNRYNVKNDSQACAEFEQAPIKCPACSNSYLNIRAHFYQRHARLPRESVKHLPTFSGMLVEDYKRTNLPATLTVDLAKVLGYLIAEGRFCTHWISFAQKDTTVFDDFCDAFAQAFPGVKLTQWRGTINCAKFTLSTELQQFFNYLGMATPSHSRTKEVPWPIFRAEKHVVAAFLRCYMEGDAYAANLCIQPCSASKTLMSQIQQLLLRFGIITKQSSFWKCALNGSRILRPYWGLTIGRQYSNIYLQEIGFVSLRKLSRVRTKVFPTSDIVPYLKAKVFETIAKHPESYKGLSADGIKPSKLHRINEISQYILDCVPSLLSRLKPYEPDYVEAIETITANGLYCDPVVEKTTKVGWTKLYDLTVPKTQSYTANGLVVHNSTTAAAFISTYQLHRFLKIPNIAKYFGQVVGTQFDFMYTATVARQAMNNLWSKFYGAYVAAPWFKDYNKFLADKAHDLSIHHEQLVTIRDTYIWYGGSKNINASYAASNDKALRGDTRLLACVDELGWFGVKGTEARANANEVYASLKNSLRTIRSQAREKWRRGEFDTPTALMINISSPSSAHDFIMGLLKQGDRDKSKVCSHAASWDINPQLKREDFRNEELVDPIKFLRDYAAIPPLGTDPFLGAEKNLERIQDPLLKPLFRYKISYIGDGAGSGKYVGAELIESSLTADKTIPRIICVDAGETQNSFAIGLYSLHAKDDDGLAIIQVDQVIEVSPEYIDATDEVIPVHFPTMEKLVLACVDKLNVKYVVWDRWQSTGETQRLRDKKIKAERYSPKHDDFLAFRSRVFAGTFKAPKPEMKDLSGLDITDKLAVRRNPWTHFYIQLATVREVGNKIVKPLNGDDDMFRTAILAVSYLDDPEIRKVFLTRGTGVANRKQRSMGYVMQRGGGATVGKNVGSGIGYVGRRGRN